VVTGIGTVHGRPIATIRCFATLTAKLDTGLPTPPPRAACVVALAAGKPWPYGFLLGGDSAAGVLDGAFGLEKSPDGGVAQGSDGGG
jgi:hypothetical protein